MDEKTKEAAWRASGVAAKILAREGEVERLIQFVNESPTEELFMEKVRARAAELLPEVNKAVAAEGLDIELNAESLAGVIQVGFYNTVLDMKLRGEAVH